MEMHPGPTVMGRVKGKKACSKASSSAAGDLYDGQGNAKEVQDDAAEQERDCQQHETISGDFSCQELLRRLRVATGQAEEDWSVADGIHNREQRHKCEDHSLYEVDRIHSLYPHKAVWISPPAVLSATSY